MVDRVLAYRRISLATEASGSLAKQKAQIEAWVQTQGGSPESVVWFTDESVSGSKEGIRRPGREGLLEAVRRGDTVAVTKIDRLARSVRDLLEMVEHFKSVGASLVFVEDNIQTGGAYGNFMLTLLAAIAQLEAEITGERIKASSAHFKKVGRHASGRVPFGWRVVPNDDGAGYVVEVDPEKGPRLKQAILNILGGASQGSEARKLEISRTGMSRLLHSPRLAGMTPDGDGVVLDSDGLPVISARARLLSTAEYGALRQYLDKPERTFQRNPDGLAGVLFCPGCKGRLYLSKGKKPEYDRYKCPSRPQHVGTGVTIASINREPVDDYLERWFLSNYGDSPLFDVRFEGGGGEREAELARLGVAISQATETLTGARDAETRQDATQRLTALLAQRDEVEAMPSEQRLIVEDTGRRMGEAWADATDQERVRLLRHVGVGWWVHGGRRPAEERLELSVELAPGAGPGVLPPSDAVNRADANDDALREWAWWKVGVRWSGNHAEAGGEPALSP